MRSVFLLMMLMTFNELIHSHFNLHLPPIRTKGSLSVWGDGRIINWISSMFGCSWNLRTVHNSLRVRLAAGTGGESRDPKQ